MCGMIKSESESHHVLDFSSPAHGGTVRRTLAALLTLLSLFAGGAAREALSQANAQSSDKAGGPAGAQTIEVKTVMVKLIERAEVPARQAGLLTEFVVTEGTVVEQGALLARIDETEARLAQRRAELELKIARQKADNTAEVRAAEEESRVAAADVKAASLARERRPDSVSMSEWDHLRLKAALAELRVERAKQEREVAELTRQQRQADFELATLRLEERQVLAPFRGVIVERFLQRGEWVEPGDKILRLIRLDRLRAECFVDAQFAQRDLVGRAVTLTIESAGRPAARYTGKVVFVSPEIDPVNRQTRIWADIENQDLSLQPGLRAQMSIESGPARRPTP